MKLESKFEIGQTVYQISKRNGKRVVYEHSVSGINMNSGKISYIFSDSAYGCEESQLFADADEALKIVDDQNKVEYENALEEKEKAEKEEKRRINNGITIDDMSISDYVKSVTRSAREEVDGLRRVYQINVDDKNNVKIVNNSNCKVEQKDEPEEVPYKRKHWFDFGPSKRKQKKAKK